MVATQARSSDMETCIQNCLDCLVEWENCATACLSGEMAQMMAKCIKLCRDCSDLCAICARFMSRSSDLHKQLCGVCAEACDRSVNPISKPSSLL